MPSIGPDDAALHPGQVGRASPALFTGLIDDAAMFPPGNAPLDRALAEHATHATAWYAELVGPLLVAADHVPALLNRVAAQTTSTPLAISVVARELTGATAALSLAETSSAVDVRAVELPLAALGAGPGETPGRNELADAWTRLGAADRAVWWEVSRGPGQTVELDALSAVDGRRVSGGAKLRTGGVEPAAVPSEAEVAAFLRHAIDVDLTFKLTAGLHHAVRRTDPVTGLEQHGVLNLLCAVKAALNGAEEDELADLLAERDAGPLVERTNGMSEADASVARAFWSSFGCCGVTEPIEELVDLGLLDPARTQAATR